MPTQLVHTCLRVRDPDASVAFYRALGFEQRGRLNFETAYNVYLGLPGDGDRLELTVNVGRDEPYDLPSAEDVDRALGGLPIIREMGGGVLTEALPIYEYETFAADLEQGVHGP